MLTQTSRRRQSPPKSSGLAKKKVRGLTEDQ
jgi:hypothetical protein